MAANGFRLSRTDDLLDDKYMEIERKSKLGWGIFFLLIAILNIYSFLYLFYVAGRSLKTLGF